EDGRIVVVKTGTFTLRTADTFDTGLYHCIGTNYNDADTLTFRITVIDPYLEHNSVNGAKLSTFVGSTLYLPCTSSAAPDAAISWVLPQHVILHHSVRNKHIFDNGTLRIQGITVRDSGYFRCVAANQYGVDLLVFQVLVRKDETTLKKNLIAVGDWEEGDGSGNAILASATRLQPLLHPSATPAVLTAHQESAASVPKNRIAQSGHKRSSYRKMTYRHYKDKVSRRFRGHRRQFVSSARRVDPERWAAFLEKTKRNSTLIEKQGEVATKPPIQAPKFSAVPGDEEEASGDLVSPEEEFMIPVTETATVSTLGRAMESVVTAGPEKTASNTPARKTFLLVAEAITPPPSPFSQSVSSDSRMPQTYLNSTIADSWERSDLSQISANGINQATVSNGASKTSTLFLAEQRLLYSTEGNNHHLTSLSTTPMTDVRDTSKSVTSQNTVDKLRVFTESIDKISTKTDHQTPVMTVSEPSPEFGHIYFHSTPKQLTPKPPLDSNIITHQQIRVIQDVRTHTPQGQQQYGRRRKISGRRRIVRPGRIPSMKEHRYNFGRPGFVRGSTAVSADVQLNMKYVSNIPTFKNLSSSINPFSPEAPLSSPSTMNMPLEHTAGTHQNTAFLREEKNKTSVRQKATTMVMPLITKGTQDTPQWKLETSTSFQTSTDIAQPFRIKQPTMATHTVHITTEIAHTISTEVSSTLESVSPSIKSRTSVKNSQRGNITWEHPFGNSAQKEILLQKPPTQQTDMFLSTEVFTMLPKTTAALSMSKMSPSRFTPTPTGGNHTNGFLSLNKHIHYGSGKSEEHLPTAKPQSYSNPATSATKETEVPSSKPTVTPIITPQTDTKVTKSKILRVGRKRGQRRKRPPKTSSQSVTAGHSTAATPAVHGAAPVPTTATSLTMPTSLTPAKAVSKSAGKVLVSEMPALQSLNTPEAPQHMPTAAMQTLVTPVTQRNTPSAMLSPDTPIAWSPTTTSQTTALLSKPFSTTAVPPATVCAASGSEPTQQIKATVTAGEISHLKMEDRVIQENHVAQPTFPARTESSTKAPAASTAMSPPSTQHPTPPP
ncbi:IGS10 protein, partial [Nycticryphes semicollaris]|nr:IGS10 protein [Nycticryphes semicollaris]